MLSIIKTSETCRPSRC